MLISMLGKSASIGSVTVVNTGSGTKTSESVGSGTDSMGRPEKIIKIMKLMKN